MDILKLEQEILKNSTNKKISCARAMEIAKAFNIKVNEVGKICNKLNIKIIKCQLGCF